jgi:3'(2'), 5'-bisphosphate nucleotidase
MTRTSSAHDLLRIAQSAAQLVLQMQSDIVRMPGKRHIKQDGSFVTPADHASLELIARELRALAPQIPVIAEEQPLDVNQTVLAENTPCWLVDSLDNTKDYALGGRNFSINIALIDAEGAALQGVVLFPALGEAYGADEEGGAWRIANGSEPLPIQTLPLGEEEEAEPLAMARPPGSSTRARMLGEKHLRFITSRGQRRACMVASGEAALCVEREGFYIWDTAPTAAILQAAGGAMLHLETGKPLRFREGLRLPSYAALAHIGLMDSLREGANGFLPEHYGRHIA